MPRALVCLVALLALASSAGCATRGGVHVEGRASQVSPPPPPAPAVPSDTPVSTDAIAVLRADPQVDPEIKEGLLPCAGGEYPVDDRYADITGDGTDELVVNVLACPEESSLSSVAGFVYNLATDPPTRLFEIVEADVELVPSTGSGGDLTILHFDYTDGDDPCCPTGQWTTAYWWNGYDFVEIRK